MYEVRTVPRARDTEDAQAPSLPRRFQALKAEQQAGALVALQQVEPGLRQAVLDEWDARCRTSTVRNPAGYLFGIIQKAIRGEFKAWAAQAESKSDPPPQLSPGDSASTLPANDVVQQHIARLQDMLRMR